jgi:phage shock protein A
MIGVEEVIIRQTLERRDEDLVPYLPTLDASGEEADTNASPSQPQTFLLAREGLPLLITKLAFNIPTSDIIENLASQVLHLMLVQDENAGLTSKYQELQEQNDQLQHLIKDLQKKVEALEDELTEQIQLREEVEAASRKGFWNIFGRRESRGS